MKCCPIYWKTRPPRSWGLLSFLAKAPLSSPLTSSLRTTRKLAAGAGSSLEGHWAAALVLEAEQKASQSLRARPMGPTQSASLLAPTWQHAGDHTAAKAWTACFVQERKAQFHLKTD